MATTLQTLQTNTYSSVTFSYDIINTETMRLYLTIGTGGGISIKGDNRAYYKIYKNDVLIADVSDIAIVKSSGSTFQLGSIDTNRGGNVRCVVYIPNAGTNYSHGEQSSSVHSINYNLVFNYNESPNATTSTVSRSISPNSANTSYPSTGGNLDGISVIKSWKNGAGTIRNTATSYSVTKSEEWFAVWKYSIVCEHNDGTGDSSIVEVCKIHGESYSLPSAPSRTGYTFVSWDGYSAGSTISNAGTDFFKFGVPSAGTLTLDAQWSAKTCAINFNRQYGTGGTSSVIATYGSSLPSVTPPTRDGYSFQGYYSSVSGGTKYYDASGKGVRTWDISSSSFTLYARWTQKSYPITFDQQNGSGGTSSATVNYNGSLPTITIPTRSGFMFNGYYTETNGGGTQYYDANGNKLLNSYPHQSSITLYASWTTLSVTLATEWVLDEFIYNSTYSAITVLNRSATISLGLEEGVYDAFEYIDVIVTKKDNSTFTVADNLCSISENVLTVQITDAFDGCKAVRFLGQKYNETAPSVDQTYYFAVNTNEATLTTGSSNKSIYVKTGYTAPNISSLILNNYIQDEDGKITGFTVNIHFSSISLIEDFGLYRNGTCYKVNNQPEVNLSDNIPLTYVDSEDKYIFIVSSLSIEQTEQINLQFKYIDFNGNYTIRTATQTLQVPKLDIYKEAVNGEEKVGIGIGTAISETEKIAIGWDTHIDKRFTLSDLEQAAPVVDPTDLNLQTGIYSCPNMLSIAEIKVYNNNFRHIAMWYLETNEMKYNVYANGNWTGWFAPYASSEDKDSWNDHMENTVIHVTNDDKTNWDSKASGTHSHSNYAQSSHSHNVDDIRYSILRYSQSSNQAMSSSGATKVLLSHRTEIDNPSMLSVSNNGIQILQSGYYKVSAQIIFSATGTAHQATLAISDGSDYILKAVRTTNSTGDITDTISVPPTLMSLMSGTTISLYYAGGGTVYGTSEITGTKDGTFLQVEFMT